VPPSETAALFRPALAAQPQSISSHSRLPLVPVPARNPTRSSHSGSHAANQTSRRTQIGKWEMREAAPLFRLPTSALSSYPLSLISYYLLPLLLALLLLQLTAHSSQLLKTQDAPGTESDFWPAVKLMTPSCLALPIHALGWASAPRCGEARLPRSPQCMPPAIFWKIHVSRYVVTKRSLPPPVGGSCVTLAPSLNTRTTTDNDKAVASSTA
jgi:hypothetical protein